MKENILFHSVGRYEIQGRLASGGMAHVFAARDTSSGRRVALKVPHLAEPGLRETERHGVLLQQALSHIDRRVPWVFEIGEIDGLMYVAMEYVAGEDLSEKIGRGPLEPRAAVGIAVELCGLLASAQSFTPEIEGRACHGMVHGDIKPKNVRIESDGGVKVLDFGIAKALSLSRKLTRNEFGSLPYSSPERIESGNVDAQSDLWSVGVVLYEMLSGRQPFCSDSTRGLERAIVARTLPVALPAGCPPALDAVIRKALAPQLEQRYASSAEMRDDLLAFTRGEPTLAERDAKETYEATRRTRPSPETNGQGSERTRRTIDPIPNGAVAPPPPVPEEPTTRPFSVTAPPTALAPAELARAGQALPRRLEYARWIRIALILGGMLLVANEMRVLNASRGLRASLPALRRSDADAVWARYGALEQRSWLQFGTFRLPGAVEEWLVAGADGLIADYRSDYPTIRERGWKEALTLLSRASSLSPRNRKIAARLRYCEGQIARINGQARKERNSADADRLFNEAVNSFEQAARLWPDWPDPYLGLARTYTYGAEDLDRATAALEQAQETGYRLGNRETMLLADGHRRRAARMWAEVASVADLPQEENYLERIHSDCERALELYEKIPAYGEVNRNLRSVQALLEQVEARQRVLEDASGWFW